LSNEPSKKEVADSWFKRIDYWKVIQKAGNLFWESKKRLITIAILLVLTGGQAITLHSSFSGNWEGGGSPVPAQNQPGQPPGANGNWQKTLNQIENQENLKARIRDLVENKQKLHSLAVLAVSAGLIIVVFALVLFFLNCYLHLLFINTLQYPHKNKDFVKKLIRGRWKKLAWMRVIFGLIYLGSFVLFLFPAAFFAWQKSWALAIALAGVSILVIFIAFIVISYVFRYSLFYLALTKSSVKESIDCGYDLFYKFWKESILSSLVNFALGTIALIFALLTIFASLIILALVALVIGLVIYLILGMAHAEGIALVLGTLLVLIPIILIGVVIMAIWQGLVITFWYLIFNEIAGCKVPEIKKESALAKTKKPVVKPVIQKEEE